MAMAAQKILKCFCPVDATELELLETPNVFDPAALTKMIGKCPRCHGVLALTEKNTFEGWQG